MLEMRLLLVGYPFLEVRRANGSPWNDERSKYKGGLHHL
jgi:hypothetical protein